jgi:hypothetical protein
MPLGGRSATGEAEGEQEAAVSGVGRRALRPPPASGGAGAAATGSETLGEADDRLVAGVAAEEQKGEQDEQRNRGQEEGAELDHGRPG